MGNCYSIALHGQIIAYCKSEGMAYNTIRLMVESRADINNGDFKVELAYLPDAF